VALGLWHLARGHALMSWARTSRSAGNRWSGRGRNRVTGLSGAVPCTMRRVGCGPIAAAIATPPPMNEKQRTDGSTLFNTIRVGRHGGPLAGRPRDMIGLVPALPR